MPETDITAIPKLRRVFRMAKAELDALTGLRDGALAYGTDTGILYRQNGDGAANWEAVTSLTTITSGNYAGDGVENRPIAHGLGTIPKIVFIHNATNRIEAWTMVGVTEYNTFNATTEYPVTAPDDTNFYVGDSLSGSKYGNESGRNYYWVAMG